MTATTLVVTGTDTGVGKTLVSAAVLRTLVAAGLRAVGYKPVASGCLATGHGLRNDDALALQAAGSPGFTYDEINPYTFEPPIAPHLAAAAAGVAISTRVMDAGHAALAARADWVIVEGAGGWQVPLDDRLDFADWVTDHRWPVLLVVGMRLGCVNHALLSAQAIAARTPLAGWIANTLPPVQPWLDENIATLEQRIGAPLRGIIAGDPPADLRLAIDGWL